VTSGVSIDQPFLMHKRQSQKSRLIFDEKITAPLPRKSAGSALSKGHRAKDATD